MVELINQDFDKNKEFYQRIEKHLRTKIEDNIQIDHVGSTAIPDIVGKNIIDILIGAKDKTEFKYLCDILVDDGYLPSQNSKTEIYQFFASRAGETGDGDVHIHLVLTETDRYNEFLLLRNYLLENSNEAKNYSNHKKELISRGVTDRKEYRRIKSEYVSAMIERAKKSLLKY